ncbi:MAG: Tfp pilus assembly protein FimT/FimU [Planctomycetota bacterium]
MPTSPTAKKIASGDATGQHGFTLIELVVVIIILGILLAQAVLSMDGITPEYQLRSAARTLGGTINWTRSLANSRGSTFVLHYDLDRGQYWIILPPAKDEDPDQPVDEREKLDVKSFPTSVIVEKIELLDGTEVKSGALDVTFDPLGHEGSHIVHMSNNDGGFISLKYSSMLGIVDFAKEPVEFEEF